MDRLTYKSCCGDYGWNGLDFDDQHEKYKCWNKLGELEDKQELLEKKIEELNERYSNETIKVSDALDFLYELQAKQKYP